MYYSKEFVENVNRVIHSWWDSNDDEQLKEFWMKLMTKALNDADDKEHGIVRGNIKDWPSKKEYWR